MVVGGGFILGLQFILIVPGDYLLLYLAAVFLLLGMGLCGLLFSPSSPNLRVKIPGSVQGFAMSASSLASIIGLLAGGFLYTQFGVIAFLIAAAIIYLVVFLSFRLLRIEKEKLIETEAAKTPV